MSIKHTLLGITSMAASLGAIGFLLVSDVAVAEEPPAQTQAKVQLKGLGTARVGTAKEAAPVVKAKSKPRRKKIDLGRFEGY